VRLRQALGGESPLVPTTSNERQDNGFHHLRTVQGSNCLPQVQWPHLLLERLLLGVHTSLRSWSSDQRWLRLLRIAEGEKLFDTNDFSAFGPEF
jgi:hypothetical protein